MIVQPVVEPMDRFTALVIITAVWSAHLRAGSARQTRAPSPQTPAPPRSCPTRGRPPPGGSARDPRPPASADWTASPGHLPHLRPPAVWAGQLVLVFQSSSRFPQSSDSLHSPCFLKIICKCCSFVSDIYTLDLLEDSEAGEAHAELLVRSGARVNIINCTRVSISTTLCTWRAAPPCLPRSCCTPRARTACSGAAEPAASTHTCQHYQTCVNITRHVSTLLDTCQHYKCQHSETCANITSRVSTLLDLCQLY